MVDAVFGEPGWLWRQVAHPVVMFGRVISWARKLGNNRRFRGQTRRLFGAFLMVFCGGLAIFIGYGVAKLGAVAELICLSVFLAGHSLHQHVKAVADALGRDIVTARQSIGMIVGRQTSQMTPPEICRAAIESDAENLSDGVIAPAFWFLLLGLPGLCLYKMINTADSMIGYKNAQFYAFGWAAAKLDDLLNYIPARLTGLLIILASFGHGGGMIAAFQTMITDAPKHASPNAGWPEAAMAGGIDVWLAGPRRYGNRVMHAQKFNPSGRNAELADINQALSVARRAQIIFALFLMLCGWTALQDFVIRFEFLFD